MFYRYKCTGCEKQFVVSHHPSGLLTTCGQVDEGCENNMFIVREDHEAVLTEANEEIRKNIKNYKTEDQDVLRERIRNHLEEINLEKKNDEAAIEREMTPAEALEMFRKAKENE
jgi:hypothetical protein